MKTKIGSEAIKPNPALVPFGVLIGTWRSEGSHPSIPNKTLHGRASFEWLERGSFLLMRSEVEEPEVPSSVAILGSDTTVGTNTVLYFDERGVSRSYQTSLSDGVWRIWRDAPEFAQRFTGTLSGDGSVITGVWEMREDGVNWKRDLVQTYTRTSRP
jgi:hypothetical protein